MASSVQKFLLGLIAVVLCLPLPTMLVLRDRAELPPWLWWIGNRTLVGVTVEHQAPALSQDTWFGGQYQAGSTRWLNENFAGRELLIRLNNQVLWSVFGKSYMADETIVRGQNDDLYTSDYIAFRDGFTAPASDDYLNEVADKAAAVQRRLTASGAVFCVLFTPDKPLLYPEDIPPHFHPKIPGAPEPPPQVDRLIAALGRSGVNYMDARVVTQKVAAEVRWRTFPRSGIHWTHLTAYYAAEALLRELETSSGQHFPHLEVTNIHETEQWEDQEGDLAKLANLLWTPPEIYTHADYFCRDPSPGAFTFVGGSFANAMDVIFDDTGAFSQINHYFYFKAAVHRFPQKRIGTVDELHIPWAEDFQSAQAVVLEINPQFVTGTHPLAFLNAALAELPGTVAAEGAPAVTAVFDGEHWYGEEIAGEDRWRWSSRPAPIVLVNPGKTPRSVRISYVLSAMGARTVSLLGPDGAVLDARPVPAGERSGQVVVPLKVPPGRTVLRLESDQPPGHPSPTDSRNLDVELLDFQVTPAD